MKTSLLIGGHSHMIKALEKNSNQSTLFENISNPWIGLSKHFHLLFDFISPPCLHCKKEISIILAITVEFWFYCVIWALFMWTLTFHQPIKVSQGSPGYQKVGGGHWSWDYTLMVIMSCEFYLICWFGFKNHQDEIGIICAFFYWREGGREDIDHINDQWAICHMGENGQNGK